MKISKGNIWEFHDNGYSIVIPTNFGYNKNRQNIMGAGLALQAKLKFSDLPDIYGKLIINYINSKEGIFNSETFYIKKYKLFMFPTKSLNREKPHLSWKKNSDLSTITQSCISMLKLYSDLLERGNIFSKIYLPMVGGGLGNLDKEDVKSVLNKFLSDDFILLENN